MNTDKLSILDSFSDLEIGDLIVEKWTGNTTKVPVNILAFALVLRIKEDEVLLYWFGRRTQWSGQGLLDRRKTWTYYIIPVKTHD